MNFVKTGHAPSLRGTLNPEFLRFFGTIGNVYTFTKNGGMNPEVKISNAADAIFGTEVYWDTVRFYPFVRTFAFGTKFNFQKTCHYDHEPSNNRHLLRFPISVYVIGAIP